MAGWADIAACYRWMHDKCEKRMARSNMWITVPVIILSTLTGSANFMLQSVVGDDKDIQKYAQIGIGGVSIFTGILTTLGNFFRYAQSSEANRVAGVAWGKFQRQLAVELALHPKERIDCMDFLKICRAELDRLIEQSPPIPDAVIKEFEVEFKDLNTLKKPDIAHGMDHTKVFKDTDTRLKQMTVEAAMMLQQKKKILHTAMLPEVDKRMAERLQKQAEELTENFNKALKERLADLEQQIKEKEAAREAEENERRKSVHLPTSFRSGRVRPVVAAGTARVPLRLNLPAVAAPPPPVPSQPPQPPLTPLRNIEIDHTVPSASNVTAEQLAHAIAQNRDFPAADFSMSFHTDPSAAEAAEAAETVVTVAPAVEAEVVEEEEVDDAPGP